MNKRLLDEMNQRSIWYEEEHGERSWSTIAFKAGWCAAQNFCDEQIQYEKDALAAMKEHYEKQLEIAKEALQEISKIKFSGADVYAGSENMNFTAKQALKDLESAGE